MATSSVPLVYVNVGRLDRVFRSGLGLVLLAFGVVFESWWGLVGLVPLLTGLFAYCPIYRLFRASTC